MLRRAPSLQLKRLVSAILSSMLSRRKQPIRKHLSSQHAAILIIFVLAMLSLMTSRWQYLIWKDINW